MEDSKGIVPGNHARGWNDPPQFLYDAQKQSGTINPGNPLATNKRIGHDLLSASAVQPAGGDKPSINPGLVPPIALPTLNHVPILNMPTRDTNKVKEKTTTQSVTVPDITESTEMCEHCRQCFTATVERLKSSQCIQEKLAIDIMKRVDMFVKMWNSGKISEAARPRCLRLACALDQELYSLANELHMKLMTDHISEVSQWMVGIKKLIQTGLQASSDK